MKEQLELDREDLEEEVESPRDFYLAWGRGGKSPWELGYTEYLGTRLKTATSNKLNSTNFDLSLQIEANKGKRRAPIKVKLAYTDGHLRRRSLRKTYTYLFVNTKKNIALSLATHRSFSL